jgi:hypothetical protein
VKPAIVWPQRVGPIPLARPIDAVRVLPYAIVLASMLAAGIAVLQRLTQPHSPNGVTVVWCAGAGILVALVLAAALGHGVTFLQARGTGSTDVTAYVLALALGILLTPAAAFFAVWHNRYDDFSGWTYPFLNKRWLVALYGIGVATFLVFPSAVERWLRPTEATARIGARPRHHPRRTLQRAGGLVAGLLLAWYFAGPPWHLERHHRAIDFHEQVHLGQLQAIDKGYLPYVGPASTQYGPGSQLLMYEWMKWSGHFDIVSFREAQVGLHLLTFGAVAVLACLMCGVWVALPVVVLAVVYSPLAFFSIGGDGTMAGSYGWGNGLRYLGALLVVPLLARVARVPRDRLVPIWSAVLLGALWGLFAWVSQENLSSTLVAASLLMLILWLTDTVSGSAALSIAAHLLAGFIAVGAVLLLYYAAHGAAREFLRNYFLVSSAVAMGFSNTWWPAGESPGHLHAYYLTAPLLVAIGILTLWDVRSRSMRRHLDERQMRLLAFLCVLLASYQTALYRSDYVHLMNTMLALPFVLVLAALDLPGWLARTWPLRAGLSTLIAALAFWIYPVSRALVDLRPLLTQPLSRFSRSAESPIGVKDGRVPFRRATRLLCDEPQAAPGMVPMRTFLESAGQIRDLVGTRRTYIEGVVAGGYTGLYYFMLDLTPGPILLEKETMIINNTLAAEAFDHFRRHVHEFDAVITSTLESHEVRAFVVGHPNTVTIERSIGQAPVYVLLSN